VHGGAPAMGRQQHGQCPGRANRLADQRGIFVLMPHLMKLPKFRSEVRLDLVVWTSTVRQQAMLMGL
jgi:hypothetical protein